VSETPKKTIGILLVVLIGTYWFLKDELTVSEFEGRDNSATKVVLKKKTETAKKISLNNTLPKSELGVSAGQSLLSGTPLPLVRVNAGLKIAAVLNQKNNPKAAAFKVEDGLVTLAGDMVIGVPKVGDFPNEGFIEPPEFPLWESNEIPFHIQPQILNSDRIYKAFELFKDTPIHFVPLAQQQDALVFEEKAGACKSYVGRVGGLQPIWIGEDCSPADIAHEIMHALGFIHEQNRTDRDTYVEILWDNVLEEFKYNFELLPEAMMRVSGTGKFDYDSIMIYPSSSFAKRSGLTTIKSKQSATNIRSNQTLSTIDIERLLKFYGQ
jgi:hypothetical protein